MEDAKAGSVKLPYATPMVIRYGSVRQLTGGSFGQNGDGMGTKRGTNGRR
ncbi:MAG: lasso RiPP family leader peptide-containing protein [Porphyrobacter sp.]|nr:lasso RiPP family leader peptide-containing protein [Porphyrobacter sp.]